MKKILSLFKDILICVLIALFINKFLFMFAFVPTGSMKPTIMEKDRILVDKISMYFREIQRGDIIVFKSPEELKDDKWLVKRVIGLPGESVEIIDGQVYINNEPLPEEYVYFPSEQSMELISIGEDEYFVLGDNRNNSYDARYWSNKTINKRDIIGYAQLFRNFLNI